MMKIPGLADRPFDRDSLERELGVLRARLVLRPERRRSMVRASISVLDLLDATVGETLQQRWTMIEKELWPVWEAGERRLDPERAWTYGPAALVLSRAVRPGWTMLSRARLSQWIAWLPADDPLNVQLEWLRTRIGRVDWAGEEIRRRGHLLGVRILLHRGYDSVEQITDADLGSVPPAVANGTDALDAVLCAEGVLARSPRRGSQRRLRRERLTPGELVGSVRSFVCGRGNRSAVVAGWGSPRSP